MFQLHPQEIFTVVRQIEDHTDEATYYVRAVIRNAKTDAVITTLNLEAKGGQRYSAPWQVSADLSGQGFWIAVVSSVYTDSDYTTKSPNYGDKLDTYLVQAREPFNPNYPAPTGPDISYTKISSLIEEALEKKFAPIAKKLKEKKKKKEEKKEGLDIQTPLNALKDQIVAAIEANKTKVDLSEVLKLLTEYGTLLSGVKKVVEDPVERKAIEASLGEIKKSLESLDAVAKKIDYEALVKKMDELEVNVEIETPFQVNGKLGKAKVKEAPPPPPPVEEKKEDERVTRLLKK